MGGTLVPIRGFRAFAGRKARGFGRDLALGHVVAERAMVGGRDGRPLDNPAVVVRPKGVTHRVGRSVVSRPAQEERSVQGG